MTNGRNCDIVEIDNYPPPAGAATLWDDVLGNTSPTTYVTDSINCVTVANNYVNDLGTDADNKMQDQLIDGWFSVGIKANNMVRSSQVHQTSFTASLANHELQITYDVGSPISGCEDPVTNLRYTTLTTTSANLIWTEPELNGQTIIGYQINNTTPFATPLTILNNNTGTTTTAYTADGLTPNTLYSFRVQPWTTTTCHSPADGNILYFITTPELTLGQLPANFTNQTNPDTVFDDQNQDQTGCFFTREDLNATTVRMNVTYPFTDNPAVNFHYKYAMTNQTYLSPTILPVSSTHNKSSFQFNGVDNEIIDVIYWDENSNRTCKYIITQTQFEFLNLIQDFRNGEFGTSGDFGVIDLVTLLVIILSQIGFNRASPIVGGIFLVFTVGGLAVMGIVSWPTVIIAAIAVALMAVVGSSKRD